MIYDCCDRNRRNAVARHPTLNGIDYIEVIDGDLDEHDPLRQRTLLVHCLKPLEPLGRDNVIIKGGERIRSIEIEWAAVASPTPSELAAEPAIKSIVEALPDATKTLVVRTHRTGDFSQYTLRLIAAPGSLTGPDSFDPVLVQIDFSFKAECSSDFDCATSTHCDAPPPVSIDIDYLAKDYTSFRRLLLERMQQLAPAWEQTSVADQGVMLLELLAYVGDHLSYRQDAVATEAYLGTARKRVSLRRHALLVDYPMHDGCTARVWIALETGATSFTLKKEGTQFLTRCSDKVGLEAGSSALQAAMSKKPVVFEPLHELTLHSAHNRIEFYTWGDARCCLPRGATAATLAGHLPDLDVGDVLLFEEERGPDTGREADADPRHRHVVRLTWVSRGDSTTPLADPLTGDAVTEIRWAAEDALPFSLCLSIVDTAIGAKPVSVARGNIVLADHGRTIADEPLPAVPAPKLLGATPLGDRCGTATRLPIPIRYRPRLSRAPLSQAGTVRVESPSAADEGTVAVPFDPAAPATQALSFGMEDVFAALTLEGVLDGHTTRWQPRRSLLSSSPDDTHFVVEVEDDGGATLRFGDDRHGKRPKTGTSFTATYRVGNGAAGNVGPESIFHVVASEADLPFVERVRNPVTASGGVDPESAESIRANAPEAFRVQERAVTPDDYADIVERQKGVQRAAASLRWTGSWHTVYVTVDAEADADASAIRESLPDLLDRYRMAGHDLEFDEPHFASLEVALEVCVDDDYFRSDVRTALLETLGSRTLSDGRRGLFHADNFTFGQPVYASSIYAAAHAVPGVTGIRVTRFQRQGRDDPSYLADGQIPLGTLEIARLDNDPSFPEHGVLRLDLHGGK